MNIYYDFHKAPWGGGNQFLRALRKEFFKMRVYEENLKEADVILFNSHHKLEDCLRIKRNYQGKIIIYRIDGPIFLYRGKNKDLDRIILLFNKLFADGVIFQSDWCRTQNRKYFNISSRYETVIHNAPDNDIFNRKGRKEFNPNDKIKLIATSWSSNIRKGFLIYKFLDENLDFSRYEMTFVGNSPIQFKNIRWIRPIPSEKVAEILKQHDIYIAASRIEACSNSLIEALSCGLPAVAVDDGGDPELVQKGGKLFSGKEDVVEKIEDVARNYSYYQSNMPEFSIEKVAKDYYKFAKRVYNDIQNREYQPKQVNLSTGINFYKMKFMILKWKGLNKIKAAKNKLRPASIYKIFKFVKKIGLFVDQKVIRLKKADEFQETVEEDID